MQEWIEEEDGEMAHCSMKRRNDVYARFPRWTNPRSSTTWRAICILLLPRAWPLRRRQYLEVGCNLVWRTKSFAYSLYFWWHDDGAEVSWRNFPVSGCSLSHCCSTLSRGSKPLLSLQSTMLHLIAQGLFARIWNTNSTMDSSLTRPPTNQIRIWSPPPTHKWEAYKRASCIPQSFTVATHKPVESDTVAANWRTLRLNTTTKIFVPWMCNCIIKRLSWTLEISYLQA